jgi:uncharacterized protein YecE (DUF72 family)
MESVERTEQMESVERREQVEAADVRVGCAGWSIASIHADRFPMDGSHLQRYAQHFGAVEINSSFYRPHKPATYARWAASVPDDFRFAVKVPREITHVRRLDGAADLLDRFLAEVGVLGSKLGPLLVQLPPSLGLDVRVAGAFFGALRERFAGKVVCEPRHPSWLGSEGDRLLVEAKVARVAADPARVPGAADPGGWHGLVYYRLHGSPRIYYSAYPADYLDGVARDLAEAAAHGTTAWCIFDNTALGAATLDALAVAERLRVV